MLIDIARRMEGGVAGYFQVENTEQYLDKIIENVLGPGNGEMLRQKAFLPPGPVRKAKLPPIGPLKVAGPSAETLDQGTFRLVKLSSALSTSGLVNAKWLRELVHENPLLMNRASGAALGIRSGERVTISFQDVSAEVEVSLIEGIHPDCVALGPGFGSAALTKTARGVKFESSDWDTGLLWWSGKAASVNVNSMIEVRKTRLPALGTCCGTVVKVARTH
jgi:anaerobic selenocysteine-containing dehydrogenase